MPHERWNITLLLCMYQNVPYIHIYIYIFIYIYIYIHTYIYIYKYKLAYLSTIDHTVLWYATLDTSRYIRKS